MSTRKVSYFYDSEIGNFHYGQGHPMKPHRVRMTHNLIVNSGLHRKMDVFRPQLISAASLSRFHSDDYINFLRLISPGKNFFPIIWTVETTEISASLIPFENR